MGVVAHVKVHRCHCCGRLLLCQRPEMHNAVHAAAVPVCTCLLRLPDISGAQLRMPCVHAAHPAPP